MVHVMRRAQVFLKELPANASAFEQLRSVVRWTMQLKLQGEMPSLPSQNSSLRATLMANRDYMDGLMEVSDRLGAWIEEAQAQGAHSAAVASELPCCTRCMRGRAIRCWSSSRWAVSMTTPRLSSMVLSTCFDGLKAR